MPEAASEILRNELRRKKPWVTKDVLDLCDERRDSKKKRYEAEGAKNTGEETGGFRRQRSKGGLGRCSELGA